MSRKTVTVFGATGTAGSACVDELIRQDHFNVQVLARKGGQLEKTSMGPAHSANWNGTFLPEFKGTPLAELFPGYIEPFVAATRAALLASSAIPSA